MTLLLCLLRPTYPPCEHRTATELSGEQISVGDGVGQRQSARVMREFLSQQPIFRVEK